MSTGRTTIRDTGCRCNVQDISQVDISGTGQTVGIVGLERIFKQLNDSGKQPDEAILDELLAMVKSKNYVPRSLEARYGAALLREYKNYYYLEQQDD